MKSSKVVIGWRDGLHLRPAAELARCAMRFRSSICLKANEKVADARSVLSIILLCATMGTVIELEVTGEDENLAMPAVETLFSGCDSGAIGGAEEEETPDPES